MDRFFRRNALFGLIEVGGRLPLLVVLGVLAGSVGPELYGNWSLVLAAVGVVSGLTALGLSTAIQRMAASGDAEKARGYLIYALKVTSMVVCLAGFVMLLAQQPFGAALGIQPDARWLVALAGLLVLTTTVEVLLDGYFKVRERVGLQSMLVLGRTCIDVAVVLFVFSSNLVSAGPESRLALYVVLSVVLKLVLLYPILLVAPPRKAEQPSGRARAEFLRYGRPLIPAGLILWVTTQGDRLVLGHTVSDRELGWYAFGASLAWNVSYLGLAVFPLLLPRISAMYDRGDHAQVIALFQVSQRVFLSLFAGAAVALALLSNDIVAVTAGAAFAPAAPILVLLSVAVGLEALLGIFDFVFHLIRRTSLVLAFSLFYMALQLSAVYVVARLTGDILAVAWAVIASVLVANTARYVVTRRLYSARLRPGLVAALLVAGCAVVAAAAAAPEMPLAARVAGAALAVAAGLVTALAVAGVGRLDRSLRLSRQPVRSP